MMQDPSIRITITEEIFNCTWAVILHCAYKLELAIGEDSGEYHPILEARKIFNGIADRRIGQNDRDISFTLDKEIFDCVHRRVSRAAVEITNYLNSTYRITFNTRGEVELTSEKALSGNPLIFKAKKIFDDLLPAKSNTEGNP